MRKERREFRKAKGRRRTKEREGEKGAKEAGGKIDTRKEDEVIR